ncbi:hypothetical protein EC988_007068 [Linderina pennispora]|nr:hypothetical protein EC988_007068 [Linderina pennispora]
MVGYPPVTPAPSQGPSSYAASGPPAVGARKTILRKKRYDISIWLQTGLTTLYLVLLIYYFVHLRHLAGMQPAIWRAGLLFLLLLVDISVIWLTVRSRRMACKSEPGAQQRETNQGVPLAGIGSNNPFSFHQNPATLADSLRPPQPAELDLQHSPGRSEQLARSHLNTPITG